MSSTEVDIINLGNFMSVKQSVLCPTFDSCGYPTDETLDAIRNWQPNFSVTYPWADLIRFCRETWNMDYGAIFDEVDEDGDALLCLVTGGWSGNEMAESAMMENWMFSAMHWHSSYRGGLVKFVIPAIEGNSINEKKT